MTMGDIRFEGQAGRLGAMMTAVVVDGVKGKEYRLPTNHEIEVAEVTEERLRFLYADIPFGLPEEPLPSKEALGFPCPAVRLRHMAQAVHQSAAIGAGGICSLCSGVAGATHRLPEGLEGICQRHVLAHHQPND